MASRLYLGNKKTSDRPDGILSPSLVAVIYILETYATDGFLRETKMEMQNSRTPLAMGPRQYSEDLQSKSQSCTQVLTE